MLINIKNVRKDGLNSWTSNGLVSAKAAIVIWIRKIRVVGRQIKSTAVNAVASKNRHYNIACESSLWTPRRLPCTKIS